MLSKKDFILSFATITAVAVIWETGAYFERDKTKLKTSDSSPCPCLADEFDLARDDSVETLLKNVHNMNKIKFGFVDNRQLEQNNKAPVEPFDLGMDVASTLPYDFEVQAMCNDPDDDGLPNITHIIVNAVPKGTGSGEYRTSYDTDHGISTNPLVFGTILGVKRYLEAHAGSIGLEVSKDSTIDYASMRPL